MTISISGQVPAEAQNGMVKLEDDWTRERTPDAVFAIVKIERDGLKFKDADQQWSATMKFTHIEPITDDFDRTELATMLNKAADARGGSVAPVQPQLDIDGQGEQPDDESLDESADDDEVGA